MKLTSDEFDKAFNSWAHIINQLDRVSLGALSTAIRTSMSSVYEGDKVRYVGNPLDSGFDFGDILIIVGVYDNCIAARKVGCENSYFVSNSDYVGYLEPT